MTLLLAFLIIFPIIFGLLAFEIKIGSWSKPIKSRPKIDFERHNALVAAWDELEASDPLAKRFRPSELQAYLPKPPPSPTRPDPGMSERQPSHHVHGRGRVPINPPPPAAQPPQWIEQAMIEHQDRMLQLQQELFDLTNRSDPTRKVK